MPGNIEGRTGEAELIALVDGNTITISMTAREGGIPLGTFLKALRSPLNMLRDLDRSLSDGETTLDWQIVGASYNSPLTLRLEGRPIRGVTATRQVGKAFVEGLGKLEQGGEPEAFSVATLESAKRMIRVVASDGIADMEFACPGSVPVRPTKAASANVDVILRKRFYFEHSTIDGSLDALDLHGKRRFLVYDPLTDEPTTCNFPEVFLADAIAALGKRVSVEGRVKFDRSGRPTSMVVSSLRLLRGPEEYEEFRDHKPVDITGGLDSVEYIRRMRDVE